MNSAPIETTGRVSNARLVGLLSLVVPGAGQFHAGRRQAGVTVLSATIIISLLVAWAQSNYRLGEVSVGGTTVSWLYAFIVVFWLWNVWDALHGAAGKRPVTQLGFLIPTILVYLIAWQVTDVNLDRLITRFSDAKIVFGALVHPDLMERDQVSQVGGVYFWIPCTTSPKTPRPSFGFPLRLDKTCGGVGDGLVLRGEGYVPNAQGIVWWVYDKDMAQLREGGRAITVDVGPDGRFEKAIKIPDLAGREGVDPNNPIEQAFEVRFTQDVGPLHPSENFGDIIGKIVLGDPPGILVSLGLAAKDGKYPNFVPGKIVETIAIGLLATLFSIFLAVPLSFLAAHNIMSRVPGGLIVYYSTRTVLNVVRSVDTLIWGIVIIVWIGLGSFAGILALAIHSVAALGKLYSEEIEHIDQGPIEALTATGATFFQVIRYAVIPQIVPPFLAYTLLRWDINMRSATVVGFVAGGGIGFFVVETIRKGGYEQYAAALWVTAIVIMLVDFLSADWRQRIMEGDGAVAAGSPRPFYRSPRAIFYSLVVLALLAYSWQITNIDLKKLLDPGPTFGKLLRDFLSVDLTPDLLDVIVKQMLATVFQALIATTLGGIAAIPFSFLAARNLMGRNKLSVWLYYLARTTFNVLRSIEALLYAAIFVFWVGIGSFAGALALAITTFALIGKLFSEAIENIEPGPVEAITASGATRLQSIVFGIVPQIVPPFVSYSIYQWDINIRIATIIGFAGGGGIGMLFSNYFNQLQYHKAGTVVVIIVIVITAMDFASAKIRERMV